MPDGSATAHLYRPKLVTTLSEGYGLDRLKRDGMAALTVAIVALPLSMRPVSRRPRNGSFSISTERIWNGLSLFLTTSGSGRRSRC